MFGHHHHHRHHQCGSRGGFGRGPFGAASGFGWGVGGREGGGSRRRMFDGEEFRLLLLALLEAEPRHGYDLIRAIEERSGGAYVPSPGVIYPALTMLDELGEVDAVASDGARKRFALTEAGRTRLAERRQAADALLARLDEMGERRKADDRAPVARAVANLHLVLRNAIGAGPERQAAIVAILDEAARRIERGD